MVVVGGCTEWSRCQTPQTDKASAVLLLWRCCLSFVVCCFGLLGAVRCALCIVWCTLCVVCCLLLVSQAFVTSGSVWGPFKFLPRVARSTSPATRNSPPRRRRRCVYAAHLDGPSLDMNRFSVDSPTPRPGSTAGLVRLVELPARWGTRLPATCPGVSVIRGAAPPADQTWIGHNSGWQAAISIQKDGHCMCMFGFVFFD